MAKRMPERASKVDNIPLFLETVHEGGVMHLRICVETQIKSANVVSTDRERLLLVALACTTASVILVIDSNDERKRLCVILRVHHVQIENTNVLATRSPD